MYVRLLNQLPALGHLPLPRNPLRLQASRDSLLGAWCGGWGGVSTTDLVVDVDDQPSDQAANRKDQLSGEGGEQEDELHQRIEEIEAGGNKDPRQPKDRTHQASYPEHTRSLDYSRASKVARAVLVAADRRQDRNDHNRNDDREAALGAGDLFMRFGIGGALGARAGRAGARGA